MQQCDVYLSLLVVITGLLLLLHHMILMGHAVDIQN